MMNRKKRAGITLLEVTIALALWMIIAVTILHLWQQASHTATHTINQHHVFENARATLDALIVNIEMAHTIRIYSTSSGDLDRLITIQSVLDPGGFRRDRSYDFFFRHGGLQIGLPDRQNEFSSRIGQIRLSQVGYRMYVKVVTDCAKPITLTSSVDIRHKSVTM